MQTASLLNGELTELTEDDLKQQQTCWKVSLNQSVFCHEISTKLFAIVIAE